MTALVLQKHIGVWPRMNTGPMQFGDDWPGVFIRGDNAMAWAMQLQRHAIAPELAALLESCVVHPDD